MHGSDGAQLGGGSGADMPLRLLNLALASGQSRIKSLVDAYSLKKGWSNALSTTEKLFDHQLVFGYCSDPHNSL